MKRLVLIVFLFCLVDSTAAIADEKFVTELYDTGQTKVEKTYKNGELNGPFTMYFRDGRVLMQGTMKNGKKGKEHGYCEFYWRSGELVFGLTGFYENGEMVRMCYPPDIAFPSYLSRHDMRISACY